MAENNIHDSYKIEKREIYQNQKNNDMFQAVTQSLDIRDPGVPFVLNKATNEVTIGTDPVKALFPPR